MNFREKAYLTLTKQSSGILGAEMYILPEGLAAYSRIVCDANYYLSKADKQIWKNCAREIANLVPQGTPTMEYGTGDFETASKAGEIVQALNSTRYIGVDLSKDSIEQAIQKITSIKADIEAIGLEKDFWDRDFPKSDKPTLALFTGGSIGNLETPLLRAPPREELSTSLATLVNRTNNGWLLVSADMLASGQTAQRYEAAYAGPDNAIFNLGVFRRMKQELGINIDPDGFEYRRELNKASGAIQHMAYATKPQAFDFDGTKVAIAKGDAFHLQNSFRFTKDFFTQCAQDAGLALERTWEHPTTNMCLHLLRRVSMKL